MSHRYETGSCGSEHVARAFTDLAGEIDPDKRQIRLRPHVTDEYVNDKVDILDLVRKRIAERKLEPKDIRKAGVTNWGPEQHWRLKEGYYDISFSQKRAYQLAVAVGLKRTKALPFSL